MLKNYIKIAFRHLVREKSYALINITGLALGIVSVLFISLWVLDEISYDRFHENGDNLYLTMIQVEWDDLQIWETTPAPLANVLREDIPEIEKVAKTTGMQDFLVEVNGDRGEATGIYAGPDFLSMFTFPLLQGDAEAALDAPDAIVISRSFAGRYFDGVEPIGRTVRIDGNREYRVTGVMENLPTHSSLQFDFLLPQVSFEEGKDWVQTWGNAAFFTYVQLIPNADKGVVEQKFRSIIQEYDPEESGYSLFLAPFTERYLYNNGINGRIGGGRISYVYLFSAVALFILLIACINFMNLTTARSFRRTREISVRMTSGAGRGQLSRQFLGEALVTSFAALFLALLFFEMLLPGFNSLTGKQLDLTFSRPVIWILLLGITLFTGLLAGSYPAFFLSSLKPSESIKGFFRQGPFNVGLRKSLVVLQFALSVILITATVVVYQQIQYIQQKNLGYNRENLIIAPLSGDLYGNRDTFKELVLQSPSIQSAAFVSDYPQNVEGVSGDLSWAGKPEGQTVETTPMSVGYDFIETMNLTLLGGRGFSPEFASDTEAYIINEAAAELMGMNSPVGEEMSFWLGEAPIIGWVENFHFNSMYEEIRPLVLMLMPMNAAGMLVRTEPGATQEAVAALQKAAEELNPGHMLDYHFIDALYEQQYRSEMLVGTLAAIATALAIFISCLGLFGLVMFISEMKTKEIGIRKVLGATVADIISLFSRDIMKLMFISALIAFPVAWYVMSRWLEEFAYRIEIGPGVFFLAGISVVVIALATVCWQSVRAALADPVTSLRAE